MKKIYLITLVVIILSAFACDEIEIPVLVDSDEITRYMKDSDDAQSLFRNDNLIFSDHYTYPLDNDAFYYDRLDSTVRLYDVYILDENLSYQGDIVQDFGDPYGYLRDAEVTVIDNIYVTTSRVLGTDTTSFSALRQLKRYAYFQKLGNDGQSYSGWLLRGYKGGNFDTNSVVINSRVDITREDFSVINGDYRNHQHYQYYLVNLSSYPPDTLGSGLLQTTHAYLNISTGDNEIMRIDNGEELSFKMVNPFSRSKLFTISALTDSGNFQANLPSEGTPVVINTLDNNPKVWNVIYIQEFYQQLNDTTSSPDLEDLVYRGWCVPFRVN